ncbi:bile acid:sodium symporter family protein [Streptomyces sp. WMMC897]|uniref:bile acid:sodium symporter family protein n=1 Tax=Streptomyces sp. WMMC897 TaxID=3014782 RepID=UPI0022B63DB8|nr:bile acid:sodium symporter family protein [Streptomyces sp. WMMC897]MCZ7415814.1 bile acid:sodium symporter [Streptomyces sp. WMMC897]
MHRLARLFDPFVALLAGTVVLAALLPATGSAAEAVGVAAQVGVGLLFFLYGTRLAPREAVAGLRHWRLHLTVLACTFLVFPLLGLAAGALVVPHVLSAELGRGLLFLCVVPSTVQSSIALTGMARGNVPAAICAGTYSSLLGILLTPLLAGLLIGSGAGGGLSADGLTAIALQLLAPFLAGQLLRRRVGGLVARHRGATGLADRGAILLVVYAAFGRGVTEGVWQHLPPWRLASLLAVEIVLLAVMLALTAWGSRALGFRRADRTVIVFAGSKKSLAAGLPMAAVLFGDEAALAVLPLMLFHQAQLVVCAVIARRIARRVPAEEVAGAPDRPERAGPDRSAAGASTGRGGTG